MSEARISKLEESFNHMQVSFGKIETALENIDRNITSVLSIKEKVTTHEEKFKVTENRLLNLEWEAKEHGKSIASINIKAALMTGAWAVIYFLINKYL